MDDRELFEKVHCGGDERTTRRNEHGDYVLPSVQDAWSGWQSRSGIDDQSKVVNAETRPDVEIDPNDLVISEFSTGGSSWIPVKPIGVRIIHKPTGLFVECSEERSIHRNKSTALELLKMRVAIYRCGLSMTNERLVDLESGKLKLDTEHLFATMEATRNSISDAFFKARPQIDFIGNRRIFDGAFQRGFDAAVSYLIRNEK